MKFIHDLQRKMIELCEKIDNSIIEILDEIKANDDGSLKDYVLAMNNILKNRD